MFVVNLQSCLGDSAFGNHKKNKSSTFSSLESSSTLHFFKQKDLFLTRLVDEWKRGVYTLVAISNIGRFRPQVRRPTVVRRWCIDFP